MAKLFAGTSGFAYPTWKPGFYPDNLPAKKFLHHYAQHLNAVEINYTFRRLPSASTLESWVAETPAGFTFALKAHMRITHLLRLAPSEFNQVFFQAIDPLRVKARLGPVLFQLQPNFAKDLDRLEGFLKEIPSDIPAAFEFRNKSWLSEDVYDALERYRAALCLAESDKLVIPHRITARFVYFRLRKAEYTPEERREVAGKVSGVLAEGKDVYVFFKHEDTPAGAFYAEELVRGI
jgi:uncharacterized protein YecE (DUF72 family)